MKDLKIKVCGMKYPDNITALSDIKPDYMGFIFYPPSKRFVGLDFQKSDLNSMDEEINKTAVFVNAHFHEVVEFSNIYGFKTIQLHGSESPEFCNELMGKGFKIIKAFGIDDSFDFKTLENYKGCVDYFLFDTKTVEHGGSGKTFGWQLLNNYQFDIPFFLSGGLSLDNLTSIAEIENPSFYGVDLNSKFEIEPGLKDIEKLELAFKILRN
ncbi:N-(5'-phosphoribosyl)anthranilate isomerase [Pedobacter psychrophilus]|uniref:N-(5'-phosphoribosyl)anthranilate isomerase n=1 Tax=Pedobacter psychrophilus TaxID=1826909 RepID=A0A179DGG7_9SPHI|nr:phosphoribosylanthranilate isomerase [Pedobacter psychrophilus]OAQ39882.1 N-(5'-phosphoribosyl)anthranilate isomerase [Pedobacter psychrophilus]